jgi:hypothetical protein
MADFIDDDIVTMRRDDGSTQEYYWGDPVTRLPAEDQPGKLRVAMRGAGGAPQAGFISDKTKFRATALLRLSMIDVQQGDGLILETPSGKVIFIDGGDNQLFARHAAARFPGTSEANPQIIDAMIITHGDADHFAGLSELRASETNDVPRKRIFVAPKRVYHNGLVKRPGKDANGNERDDTEFFGATTKVDEQLFATGLVSDPRDVPATDRNRPFNDWAATLEAWGPRTQAATGNPMDVTRLDHESAGAFDFLADDNIAVELLGPIVETVEGAPALRFLRAPPSDADLMLGNKPPSNRGGYSASHTINVRFMFTGDMNQESMERLRNVKPDTSLRAEILKAPHHGSADFDMDYLRDVSPVVSMISSGDESAVKEYIHPRATLMAALGKASRTTPAVILCTELVAFFATRGVVTVPGNPPRTFFAFERTNFGIIHIRTDGERVLALTHSGRAGLNEAYRFTVSTTGSVEFAAKVVKRSAPHA